MGDNAIVLVTKAERMLAEAKTPEALNAVWELADMAQHAAKLWNLDASTINHCLEIKALAGRRLGQEDKATPGGDRKSKDQDPNLEVDLFQQFHPRLRSDWKLLARHPEKAVRAALLEASEDDRKLSWYSFMRLFQTPKPPGVPMPIPKGKFACIAVDPPWPYGTEYDPETRRVASPYPEMSLEKIAAIALPAADNCVLWLWTTHAFILRHSSPLLDGWGFREVSIVTWDKDKLGMGHWLRSSTEFVIMAVKGKPKTTGQSERTLIRAKPREHSRKPDEFYALAERVCGGPRLDMFSREPRKGWEQWGNETSKF